MGSVQRAVKRLFDVVFSLVGMILASPICLVIAVMLKRQKNGPVIFSQERIGYKGRPFVIYKFRTMSEPEKEPQLVAKCAEGQSTKTEKFLREHHLDELPQLFNILKGDMSFVGPRPELLLYTTQYTKEQECILWVRPGITDRSSIVYIAQDEIVGTENPVENFEKYILPEKNRLRVEYALHQSFPLDVELFFETIGGVFGKAKKMADEKHKQGAKEPQK